MVGLKLYQLFICNRVMSTVIIYGRCTWLNLTAAIEMESYLMFIF